MSVIRRKRKFCIWVIAAILLICTGILCFFIFRNVGGKKAEVFTALYLLNTSKEVGDTLYKKDVKKVIVKTKQIKFSSKYDDFEGKKVRMSLKKGTILMDCMFCEKNDIEEGLRKIGYSFIKQTMKLSKGDYVDVRISFPNGADFIILSKKKVQDITEQENQIGNILHFLLNEKEIMYMSSGVVDAYLTEGAYLYTVQYVNRIQKGAVANYPVNEVVKKLIEKDPNIINKVQDTESMELRKKIYQFLPENKQKINSVCEKEELVYFD